MKIPCKIIIDLKEVNKEDIENLKVQISDTGIDLILSEKEDSILITNIRSLYDSLCIILILESNCWKWHEEYSPTRSYEWLNNEQKVFIDRFIDLITNNPTKGDLMRFCKFTPGKVDSAMDYRIVDEVHKVYPTFDTFWHVNSYEEPTPFGDFRNLGQEVIQRIIKELNNGN